MDSTQNTVEPVTMSEVLALSSWNRPRTDQEIHDFLARREAAISLTNE